MLLLVTTLSLVAWCQAATVWDNLTATIAVMEYQPTSGTNSTRKEQVLENTLQYLNGAVGAYLQSGKFDLVVFPEATLRDDRNTSSEIVVNSTCIECDEPVRSLSSLALNLGSYVVVNLVERARCDPNNTQSQNCKNFGYNFYNTDVVFNRSGTIVAKYRKHNLFGEYDMDQPEAEAVTFETDFGVTFGMFTCFDILFRHPAEDLVGNVDAVLFPTMWFSEMPFLTAVQTQQMWAQTHDKVFFGAGANNPKVGSGGSGIYNGSRGALVSAILGTGGSRAFVYQSQNGQVNVAGGDPKISPAEMDGFYLKRDKSLDSYTNQLLNTSLPEANYTLCHSAGQCCNFTVKLSRTTPNPNLSFYTYRLFAYSGIRDYDGVYNGGIDICAIVACTNSSVASCGRRFDKYGDVQWPVTFTEITIKANFEDNGNRTQYPNSLLSSILPIDVKDTDWVTSKVQVGGKNYTQRIFTTTQPQNQILTFAIFGRNFQLDSPPTGKNAGNGLNLAGFLVVVVLAALVV